MNREYHRWYSSRLGRDMEVLLFGHAGEPVLLLPTGGGRFHQAEDSGLLGAIADRVQAGRYVVVCADSVDEESWFNQTLPPRERVDRHAQWEAYLLHEVVPLLRSRSTAGRLTLGGRGLGGAHAYNIGLRHPDTFQRLLSLGGRFETDALLDGHQDERVYEHSCLQWLPGATDPAHLASLRRMEMVLAVGEHDAGRPSNEHLSKLLWSKDLPHHLALWSGDDPDGPVWQRMLQHYLPS